MAISSTTLSDLALGIGTLVVDTTDVGATGTDGNFKVEQDIYWPDLQNARGPIAGTGRVTKETATLSLTLKEFNVSKLALALPTLTHTSDATSEYTLTPAITGMISAATHKTITWLGTTIDGKACQIKLLQGLAKGGINMKLSDTAEAEYEVMFRSYYTAAAPTQRCWQVLTAEQEEIDLIMALNTARFGMRLGWVDDDTISVGAGACVMNNTLVTHTAAHYTFAALDTGSRALGRDYSVHATADGIKLHLLTVDNSGVGALFPSGYAAATSRLLGYFHNGPKADGTVGAGRNQAIFQYSVTSNDLLDESYPYRAHADLTAGIPLPGMVEIGGGAIAIYQASREDATASAVGTSNYPTSRYGMVPWHNATGWAAMMVARNSGQRLPTWEEWLGAVEFSPGLAVPAIMNGNTYYGSASDDVYLVAPGALTSALAGAGAGLLSNGVYKFRVVFVSAIGKTQGGTANAGTTVVDYTTDGQIALTNIPLGAAGTTAREIYRTAAGGSTYKLDFILSDNTTTTGATNLADASLGATVLEYNTTGAQRGTPDPTQAGRTLTGTGPRTTQFVTAAGRSWYSPAGLADPVGNVWEWVAQFFGGLKTSSPGTAVAWGYNGDYAYNFQGQSYNPDTGGWTEGLPALLLVGGSWNSEASAGVRTAYAYDSPGYASMYFGFRLAR